MIYGEKLGDTPEGRLAEAAFRFAKADGVCHTCGSRIPNMDFGMVCKHCGKTLFRAGVHEWKEFLLPHLLAELLQAQVMEASRATQRNAAEQAAHVQKLRQALAIVRQRIAEMNKK